MVGGICPIAFFCLYTAVIDLLRSNFHLPSIFWLVCFDNIYYRILSLTGIFMCRIQRLLLTRFFHLAVLIEFGSNWSR